MLAVKLYEEIPTIVTEHCTLGVVTGAAARRGVYVMLSRQGNLITNLPYRLPLRTLVRNPKQVRGRVIQRDPRVPNVLCLVDTT